MHPDIRVNPMTPPIPTRRQQRGATAVEAALGFLVFISLSMAIMDVSWVLFVRTTLQHAVSEAGRFGITGRKFNGNSNQPRVKSIVKVLRDQSSVTIPDSAISVTSVTPAGVTNDGPGRPGDVVTVRVQHQVPLLTPILGRVFPGGTFPVDVAVSFRNERFKE